MMNDENGEIDPVLELAFTTAETVDGKLQAFNNIIAFASAGNIHVPVFYFWAMTEQLIRNPNFNNPQQVFHFGITALQSNHHKIRCFLFPYNDNDIPVLDINVLRRCHGPPFFLASVCYVLGTACFGLQRFDQSLSFLEWALDNLTTLHEKGDNNNNNMTRCDRNCVRYVLAATQLQIYNVKVKMGKLDEAVAHAKNALGLKEMVMEEGSVELGEMYVEMYEACAANLDVEVSIWLCLKALDIRLSHNGEGSWAVTVLRVDLAVLYYVVRKYEKAIEEVRLWENNHNIDHYLAAEIRCACMLIRWRRCEEAVEGLQGLVLRPDVQGEGRVRSFVIMADASCRLTKFDDARRFMEEAKNILENDNNDPLFVGDAYVDMSGLYENMDEFETAISVLKRTFGMFVNHRVNPMESLETFNQKMNLLVKSSLRLFSLISLAGRENQEIPFLRSAVEQLRECFGEENIVVGYGCAKLGAALNNSGQEDEAVTLIENATDIMDSAIGTHHVDSLKTRHDLSEIYAKLGRYTAAIENQTNVVENVKGLGPFEQEFIDNAVSLLKEVKEHEGLI